VAVDVKTLPALGPVFVPAQSERPSLRPPTRSTLKARNWIQPAIASRFQKPSAAERKPLPAKERKGPMGGRTLGRRVGAVERRKIRNADRTGMRQREGRQRWGGLEAVWRRGDVVKGPWIFGFDEIVRNVGIWSFAEFAGYRQSVTPFNSSQSLTVVVVADALLGVRLSAREE
jgi:hypothetical protein